MTTSNDFAVLSLRDEAREVFINALMNPPAPNQALRAAADRYRKHMRAADPDEVSPIRESAVGHEQ